MLVFRLFLSQFLLFPEKGTFFYNYTEKLLEDIMSKIIISKYQKKSYFVQFLHKMAVNIHNKGNNKPIDGCIMKSNTCYVVLGFFDW